MRRLVIAMAAVGCLVAPASAATVTPMTGGVSVNTGSGFRTIHSPTSVAPGTRVMAAPNGEAVIRYHRCYARVVPGRVYIVEDEPVCDAAVADRGVGAEGVGLDPMTVVVGGWVLGTGIAGAIVAASP